MPGQPVAFVVPPRHPCLPRHFFWLLLEITRYITSAVRGVLERVPSVRVCENEGHFSQLSKANIFNFDEIHFQFTSSNSILKHSAQLANILLHIFF